MKPTNPGSRGKMTFKTERDTEKEIFFYFFTITPLSASIKLHVMWIFFSHCAKIARKPQIKQTIVFCVIVQAIMLVDRCCSDSGPQCQLLMCGWKGKISCRSFLPKFERGHYLRLCGVELKTGEVMFHCMLILVYSLQCSDTVGWVTTNNV